MAHESNRFWDRLDRWGELVEIVRPLFLFCLASAYILIAWLGITFTGGIGRIHTWPQALVGVIDCGMVAFFALGAIYIPAVRRIAIRPGSTIKDSRGPLLRIGFVTGLLTILMPLSVLFHSP